MYNSIFLQADWVNSLFMLKRVNGLLCDFLDSSEKLRFCEKLGFFFFLCWLQSRAIVSCPYISSFSTFYYTRNKLIIDSKILMLKINKRIACLFVLCIKHILIKRNHQCHIISKQIIIQTWRSIQRLEVFHDEDRRNNRNVHQGCWCSL